MTDHIQRQFDQRMNRLDINETDRCDYDELDDMDGPPASRGAKWLAIGVVAMAGVWYWFLLS